MRVLMVHSFHHPRGGDLTYTRQLTQHLRAAGHTVAPLSMRHPDNDPTPWEIRFPSWVDPHTTTSLGDRWHSASRMLWNREAARACAGMIRDFRPDIAHIQHVHRHLTPSILGPLRRAGVPIVWTVHDYELICPEGHLFTQGKPCTRCEGGDYRQALTHRCKWGQTLPSAVAAAETWLHRRLGVWQHVDRFLCPSRFLADMLIRFGLPAQRVTHLPNLLSPTEPANSPGSGWIYAGRLATEKGVDVALEAAARLPHHPFDVYGDGPARPELEAVAEAMAHVRFHGAVPPQLIGQHLRAASVVAVPSRWYENFPYAVLEAQAAGRAVVASRIGGIPEQITHGQDGLLVPPGDPEALADAVRSLLEDPTSAQALGRAGAARVRARLSPSAHLSQLLGIYAALRG